MWNLIWETKAIRHIRKAVDSFYFNLVKRFKLVDWEIVACIFSLIILMSFSLFIPGLSGNLRIIFYFLALILGPLLILIIRLARWAFHFLYYVIFISGNKVSISKNIKLTANEIAKNEESLKKLFFFSAVVLLIFSILLILSLVLNLNFVLNLYFILFTGVIFIFNFILGRQFSLRILFVSYIAIFITELVSRLSVNSLLILNSTFLSNIDFINNNAFLTIRILIFIFVAMIILTKANFIIYVADDSNSALIRLMMALTYSILTTGLIVGTMLMYFSGVSLSLCGSVGMNEPALAIYQQSRLVRLMINNYYVWFSMPVITFIISSFFGQTNENSRN